MVRPKVDAPGPSAQERLVDAFWSMLSEMDFSLIRLDDLKRRAGVNHNTFYRYYRSLENMGTVLASKSASIGMSSSLIPAFCGTPDSEHAPTKIGNDAANAVYVAQNGSRPMVDLMCSSAIENWLEGEGIAADSVCDEDRDLLASVFWGVAAIASRASLDDIDGRAASFRNSGNGKAFAESLARLAG